MTRSASSTYDDDFYAWTQEQAAALRRLPTDAVGNAVDIAHVAEEIEDLGKRDLREVVSFLGRLFEHLFKIESIPSSPVVPHWRSEVRLFQRSAMDAFAPSMRRSIDLTQLWKRSRRRAAADLADADLSPLEAGVCPFTLDELLNDAFDIDAALAKLARSRS